MRTLKSIFGVAGALAPIGYCGYLVYYFLDVSGSVQEAQDIGLGPTVLGLSVVGLLFCIPLIFKIMRLIRGSRPPRSGGNTPRGNPQSDDDDDGGAAADAAIARYLARKAAESVPDAPSARPAQQGGSSAGRSFGRKSV